MPWQSGRRDVTERLAKPSQPGLTFGISVSSTRGTAADTGREFQDRQNRPVGRPSCAVQKRRRPQNSPHSQLIVVARIFHPILFFLANATRQELARQELARQVAYLKTENQILRARLPKKIVTTAEERRRLVKAGRGLGKAIHQLVSIVTPATFLHWLNADAEPKPKKKPTEQKPGRPKTPGEVRDLIVRIAKETGWGYTRILGELRKLGIRVSRQTVVNTLKAHGLDPGPTRGKGSWDEFIKIHVDTLWACDFLSNRVWSWKGPIDLYLLVFIHIGSRRVWISSSTAHPDAAWVAQQARNFCMDAPGGDKKPTHLIHDADTKFTAQFRDILKSEGIEPKRLTPASPNMNAFVERFVQTIQVECLDHFIAVGQKHLNYLVREFVQYYHRDRPHQGVGNVTLGADSLEVPIAATIGEVVCDESLGGLLKSYRRAA